MQRISSRTIDEVNERVDFASLAGEYTQLERRGSEFWGKCPFHVDKTPSFHIRPDVRLYKCFSCGRGGSVINFYMEMEKVDFPTAVVQLAKKYGIEVIYEGNVSAESIKDKNDRHDEYVELYNRLADTYKFFLHETEMGKASLNYLVSRGVTKEMAEQFKIGYAPKDGKWLKSFLKSKNYSDEFLSETGLFSKNYPDFALLHDRLMFPIFDRRGDTVGFSGRFLGDAAKAKTGKYVNTPETKYYKKGEILFGFNFARNEVRKSKKIIICEGNFDVISFHQAGISNAVATCGTALTENHIKMVSSFVDEIYLCFDSDSAGIEAAMKAILLCRKFDLTVKVVSLEGGKDPSEVLQNNGKNSLTNAIKGAILDADFLLSVLSKKYDIGTPDGKRLAAMAFFPYVNSLSSEMQKSASLQRLSQAYNINVEAITKDFDSQNIRFQNKKSVDDENYENKNEMPVKIDAETRAILAVISNMEFFKDFRNVLSEEDFESELARDMFIALEECYREGSVSFDSFISRCTDERVKKLVIDSVTSEEFKNNSDKVVDDCVKLIKKMSLSRQRQALQNKLIQCGLDYSNIEQRQVAQELANDIQNIDNELKKFVK